MLKMYFFFALLLSGICLVRADAAPVLTSSQTLASGATLLTSIDRTSPRISISLLVRAGSADENSENAGWRRLVTDAMLRAVPVSAKADNTEFDNMRALQKRAEALGGQIGAGVSDDVIEFWVSGSSNQQRELLQLLLRLVQRARLSDADIDAARRSLLARLDEGEDIAARATQALRSQLYRDARGELTAYGLSPLGTFESLNSLTNERVRALHQTFFQPARWTIAVAGDLNLAAIKSEFSGEASATPAPTTASQSVPFFATPDKSAPPLIVRQMNTPAGWVFVSYIVPMPQGNDLPALRVLAALLGELPQARLSRRLLSARALLGGPSSGALQVAVQWTPRRFAGEFVIFAQTDPQNVNSVKDAILEEVNKLRAGAANATELQQAKNFVRGNWAIERETLRERAFRIAIAPATASLPDASWPAAVNAVTAADVRRVATKYLQGYAVALIMPEE